jgi:predicted ATPase/class 3 adenylate cyclase
MRCSKCGTESTSAKKFCAECGSTLPRSCPKCAADNKPTSKFCEECGTALEGKGAAEAASLRQPGSATGEIRITSEQPDISTHDGERKTVTALFADIKGSMELIEDLDPEDARAIVDPALKLMMDAVHHYEGYVAQSTGDGIFALFGAPVAHEDHPLRALHAARRMQEDLKRYADKLRERGQPPLSVRVGINSGEVVVRSIQTGEAHTEYTPIGHSVSLASRLQTLAVPGSVVIGESVRKFVEGFFELKALGASRIKGVSEPVPVFEVTGLGPLRTRLQRAAGRGLTKFVGREREMEALRHAAEQARAGHGQIVAAMVEPGVGKSRLFHEFKATSQSGWMVLEAFSVSHGKASAYLPLIDLLHGYFKITGDDEPRTRREKVAGRIAILDRALEDTLPYLFALLGIVEGDDQLAQIDAQTRKRRTQEAIRRILLRESLNQQLIVIFEDLHWIDEQTQEFLNLLADSLANAKMLLLVNYRPEYSHRWNSKTYYTQLRLDPLGKESAEEMLSALLGGEAELVPLKRLIIERTEGTPFFMEETVQALLDEGSLVRNGVVKLTRPLAELRIPPTVQAILASRIDRLPSDAKDLLQTLAVIGREFPLGLIKGVTRREQEELERMLDVLQLGEFIYEQPSFSESAYIFKHALTQEVAYGSMLMKRRKELHEATARQIESLFNSRLEDHYVALAHHYSSSGNSLKALEYLQLAAQQAMQRSANAEAISHLNAAMQFLKTLPETPQRDRQELALQTMLGPALIATKGNGAPEVGAVYNRALQLGRQSGEDARLFPLMFGLRSFHLVKAELQPAFALGQQLLSLAEDTQDAGLMVEAHLALGNSLFLFGKFTPALKHFEQSFSLYDPKAHHVHALTYGLDPGVFCLGRSAWLLELLGHSDQASKKMEEALALAHKQSHAFSLAVAIVHMIVISNLRREWRNMQEQAETLIALCMEQGFGAILAQARSYKGYALAQQGQTEPGIAELRAGMDAQFATGASLFRPGYFCFLAEAYGTAGRFEEALDAIAEGLAITERTGERKSEAELHRFKGELMLSGSGVEPSRDVEREAEECFRKAIEIARQQGARLFELRAVISLSRLWKQHGKNGESRQRLAEIYGWFTEGFDTADLKDAKALLNELGN